MRNKAPSPQNGERLSQIKALLPRGLPANTLEGAEHADYAEKHTVGRRAFRQAYKE